jgi:hypothetical protein
MTNEEKADLLQSISENDQLLETARRAIENVLIEWRDSRLSVLGRRNGLVVYEKDGRESPTIRMGSETAVRIGLRAIADRLRATHPTER